MIKIPDSCKSCDFVVITKNKTVKGRCRHPHRKKFTTVRLVWIEPDCPIFDEIDYLRKSVRQWPATKVLKLPSTGLKLTEIGLITKLLPYDGLTVEQFEPMITNDYHIMFDDVWYNVPGHWITDNHEVSNESGNRKQSFKN